MKKQTGFTIVELLIVIVVIGILAAITIVAYNGMQQRTRDAKRVNDIAQISKALKVWAVETGEIFNAIPGEKATSWFSAGSTPTLQTFLVNGGYLSPSVQDPAYRHATYQVYMGAYCTHTDDNRRVLLAKLENPPTQSITEQLGGECPNKEVQLGPDSTYGMNYARLVTSPS